MQRAVPQIQISEEVSALHEDARALGGSSGIQLVSAGLRASMSVAADVPGVLDQTSCATMHVCIGSWLAGTVRTARSWSSLSRKWSSS